MEVLMYMDIHESDGDLPSIWQVVDSRDSLIKFELDATLLSPEERLSVPDDVREAGRALFEQQTQPEIDEAVKKMLEGEN